MTSPLNGLKILDFSTLLPGPYASMLLADMGAEVLRVESPNRMDLVRAMPPQVPCEGGQVSAVHAFLNRGKRSIALDLKRPQAIDIVRELVREYDIVLEQFRPGVMDRLGIGYTALSAINPGLIYCAITGYGQTGPYAHRAGHDINYLALSGVASYSGRRGQGPSPLGVQLADVAGGSHHAVMGILAAVIARQQTGKGQCVDISMTDAAFALNAMSLAGFLAGGEMPVAESQWLNGGSFYDYYATSDGRYLAVGGLEPQFLQGLFTALGRPDMASLAASLRSEDQQKVKAFLGQTLASQCLAHWCEFFKTLDVCVEPVLTLDEAVKHPQLQARNMVLAVANGDQTLLQPGVAIRFSNASCTPGPAGTRAGHHTVEILQALKYSAEQIDALRREGVIKVIN